MTIETPFAADPVRAERPAMSGNGSATPEIALASIEFRVLRSGSPARRMRLNTTRCTLGSGEGCTVRLNDPTLRPMHAVVLRDSNRVLLRAYTVPIEVNGHLTGETFLHLGDTFTLGSYQFELIDAPETFVIPETNHHSRTSRSTQPETDQEVWSSLPLRTATTPLTVTDSNESKDGSNTEEPAHDARSVRPRLSFVGGNTFVSEAVQNFANQSFANVSRTDAPLRANQKSEAEQLRREVEAYRKREQQWKEQDAQHRAELADAISRFQQTQERAKEASDAVSQMRARMAQLTSEMESLAIDSVEFRQQAAQRQSRLQQAADAANEARADAIRQRGAAYAERDDARRERDQLIQLDRTTHQQANHYESLLDELRQEIKRLETDCAKAREYASSSANDPHLVESLQSRLLSAESQRNADRLSWEQEATALQETIQQLSIELATATGQLSQTQAEDEATQAELNAAYERLTIVRRELSERPTTDQWNELQEQLAETAQQLVETEKQLGILRRDYDELLGRQSVVSVAETTPDPIVQLPVAAENSVEIAPESPDSETQSDHGWPTYQAQTALVLPPAANPQAWQQAEAIEIQTVEPELAIEPISDTEPEKHDEPSMGSLAKQLIAQLDAARSAESRSEVTSSVTQSHGAWVTSSSVWERVASQADDSDSALSRGFEPRMDFQAETPEATFNEESSANESPWQPVESPSVWDLRSHLAEAEYGAEEPVEEQPARDVWSANQFDDSDVADDGAIDQTFMFSGDLEAPYFDSTTALNADSYQPQSEPRPVWSIAAEPNFGVDDEVDGATRAFDFHEQLEPLADFEPEPEVAVEDESTVARVEFVPVAEAPANPDDDSIEAYMNRLLQRVQGQSGTPAATAVAKPVAAAKPKETTEASAAIETPKASPAKPAEVIDPSAPLIPRSQAPEDAGNMAAMRELANETANSAISLSVRAQGQQLKSKAVLDLMQAGVVLVCAFAFYMCGNKITSLKYVWYTAAGLAAALSVFFIMDMLKKLSMAKATFDRANAQANGIYTPDK